MGYVVKMPKLGLEMEQGTVLEWYVDEGDEVTEGDVLAEIESEKSIGEIEAREDGVVRLCTVGEDESVPPGTPIGIVAAPDEDIADLEAEVDSQGETEAAVEPSDAEPDATVDASGAQSAVESAEDAGETAESGGSGGLSDVRASPRAKRRAQDLGVDLTAVDGTGPQGAITEGDVEAAAADTGTAETAADATTGASTEAPTEEVRASPRAKRRAEELDVDLASVDGTGPQGAITEGDVETAATDEEREPPTEALAAAEGARVPVPTHRYRTTTLVTDGEEADALVEATGMAAEAFDLDVAPLDVLVVTVSAALAEHPKLNATFEDETHHLHERQHVAIAVDADGDVVRPVVSDVDDRPFAEVVEARHDRTDEAVASGVSGGRATFALASDEAFDETPRVVAPPTVAGLVVNHSRRRAVPTENGVELRRYLTLDLTYDSRAVGDADAEAFCETVLERIGDAPGVLLRTYR